MDWSFSGSERVRFLQTQLFPVCATLAAKAGFLGSFLSNSLKTNQLEVNTDAKTLRPIARLKEPRDLFALPKERDYDCPQQAPRWPTECQVLDERIYHIEYAPETPEPYYQPTGKELQPRPVGEENGVIVYNYMPTSAVHYGDDDDELTVENVDGADGDYDAVDVIDVGGEFKDLYDDVTVNNDREIIPRGDRKCKINCDNNDDDDDDNDDTDSSNKENVPFSMENLKNKRNLSISSSMSMIEQSNNADEIDDDDDDEDDDKNLPFLQFSRSSVGGSKLVMAAHPTQLEPDELVFESRFESGNLARAIKITPTYYELYLRPDMYTNRHTQWFYFRVKNTRSKTVYRFSIINLTKPDSLYKEGMRPLMYSKADADNNNIGWRRCGDNIVYFRNEENGFNNNSAYHRTMTMGDDDDDDHTGAGSYTLSFNIEFKYDDDTVYFAHSYPYTYSDLQDYLMSIQRNPVKSKFCKLRLLCRSLAGNNVYYLTVTAPPTPEEADNQKKKKAVIISARVHPGETPSSWMMKGLMDFITGDSSVAKKLRHKFIFKLIPMLNPDGVIVGNTRSSLTGRDLNRQYRTVIRETYPSIWNTKAMIRRLMEDCGVAMYCDMHAHSRKHNIFIYGCENLKRHPDRRLLEQVFPLMLHKNVADKFSFENCKFKVQKNKEGTGRIVVWVLGVTNSYTLEASFGGSTMGGRANTHFSTADYEHIGRAYCETLMDYYDDNPVKEKLRMKILTRLSKEGSSADEPLNIPLTDYSSDEGDTSSSSDDEGKDSNAELEGPCCSSLKVPPSSPVLPQKFRMNKKIRKPLKIPTPKVTPIRKRPRGVSRAVLELPTTDPGSDFFDDYSSDEETNAVSDTESSAIFRRHKPRKSDNIRKLTFLGCETQYLMPPELIVRSASSKSDDNQEKMSFSKGIIKEFPPISKKTKSWHNFNRCSSTIKIRNLNELQISDSLQYKLSLKKQIWTGTHSDSNINESCNSVRPLSWGVPALMPSNQIDNVALLTACSQKLAEWKENEKKLTKEKHSKSLSKLSSIGSSIQNKDNQQTKTKLTKDKFAPRAKSATVEKKPIEIVENTPKIKRRTIRSTLNKIVETAEIITHLSKNPKMLSSTTTRRQKSSTSLTVTASSLQTSTTSLKDKTNQNQNKFKTGGLVVTATVQPQQLKKPKKIRLPTSKTSTPPISNGFVNGSGGGDPLVVLTNHQNQNHTQAYSDNEESENVKIVVNRKQRSKKKNKEFSKSKISKSF